MFTQLRRLDRGQISPIPLQDFAKTGDLSDCGKIVVEVEGEAEYRIVVRERSGRFDIIEVLVVEQREHDLAYLLAGLRLERLVDPIRRSDTLRRVDRIRRNLAPPE